MPVRLRPQLCSSSAAKIISKHHLSCPRSASSARWDTSSTVQHCRPRSWRARTSGPWQEEGGEDWLPGESCLGSRVDVTEVVQRQEALVRLHGAPPELHSVLDTLHGHADERCQGAAHQRADEVDEGVVVEDPTSCRMLMEVAEKPPVSNEL
eukprot:759044-Hanusia_phi.AAC.1